MRTNPPAQTVFAWLRANLGPKALAALTSTDAAALQASVQIVPLWSPYASPDIAAAWGACVRQMQPHTRQFAFHAVAHIADEIADEGILGVREFLLHLELLEFVAG